MDTEIQTSNTSEEITPRNNIRKNLVILLVTLLLIAIFGSAALYLYLTSKQTETNNSNDEVSAETNDLEGETEDTSTGKETSSTYYNYVEYKDDDTSFLYPEGWEVEVSKEVESYCDGYEPDPTGIQKLIISNTQDIEIKLGTLLCGWDFAGDNYFYNPQKPLVISTNPFNDDYEREIIEYKVIKEAPIFTKINSINEYLVAFPEKIIFEGKDVSVAFASPPFSKEMYKNEYVLNWSFITIVEGNNLKGFKPILKENFNKVIIDAKCPSQSMDDAKRCTELITTFLESLGKEDPSTSSGSN